MSPSKHKSMKLQIILASEEDFAVVVAIVAQVVMTAEVFESVGYHCCGVAFD